MQSIRHRKLIQASIGFAFTAIGVAWFAIGQRPARAMSPVQSGPTASLADETRRAAAVNAVSLASPPSPSRPARASSPTPATPAPAAPPAQTLEDRVHEREARRERARIELERLMRQDPESFLAVFDFIDPERGNVDEILPLRSVTERYITARSAILQRMQARFIDDPDSDHGRELEELTRLEREFRRELDWYAQKVPDVANFDEILHTTTLRLPSFVTSSSEAYPEKESIALDDAPEGDPELVEHSQP